MEQQEVTAYPTVAYILYDRLYKECTEYMSLYPSWTIKDLLGNNNIIFTISAIHELAQKPMDTETVNTVLVECFHYRGLTLNR